MKFKKIILYFLLITSIAYLIFNRYFSTYGFGMMMYHHYPYYSDYTFAQYYLRLFFNVIAYLIIALSLFTLIKSRNRNFNKDYLKILDVRLSKGEITLDEYKFIKGELNKK